MSFSRSTQNALRQAIRASAPRSARSFTLMARAAPKAAAAARTLGVSPRCRCLPHPRPRAHAEWEQAYAAHVYSTLT